MDIKLMGLPVLTCAALVAVGCGSSPPSGASSGSGAPAATTTKHADVSPAGDIPDNQAYVAYAPAGSGYSVKVPEGWSRTRSGGVVVFTDKLNAIRLASGAAPSHAGRSSTVKRTAGSAQRLVYTEPSTPNPVTGKTRTNSVERYVFRNGGRTAVLTLTGPKGADNVDPWRIVTDSLRWTR
jgi:hypothetical protein